MDISHKLLNLLETPAVIDQFVEQEIPMLSTAWGAKDEDALIHTLGINLLAAIGRKLGFFALVEFPVPRAIQWQSKLVRVDAAWFDVPSRRVVLLSEFERLSMDTDMEKLTNLYVAAHGCDLSPDMLLLCVWSLDGQPVDLSWFDHRKQFPVPNGPHVGKPGKTEVAVLHAIFGRQKDQLHLMRIRRLA